MKTKTVQIELIIEKSKEGLVWGRVTWNDNLIVENEKTIPELETKIKSLLKDFEELDPDTVVFTHRYDMYSLFNRFDFLKVSSIADHAGMNPGLLRQYASGVKNPSAEQAKKIERTLHKLAADLQSVHIYTA